MLASSFFPLGSFSYTSRAGFIWGVSTIHPVLASFLSRDFFYFYFIFTHPVLSLFSSGEFLLHIPSSLYFSVGSFSYTSHASFLIWRVSLSYPMLATFLSGEFLPCWLHFYLGSFSYTSHAGLFLFVEFLLHIPCWLHFYLGTFS